MVGTAVVGGGAGTEVPAPGPPTTWGTGSGATASTCQVPSVETSSSTNDRSTMALGPFEPGRVDVDDDEGADTTVLHRGW